jgi:hypothetical protein
MRRSLVAVVALLILSLAGCATTNVGGVLLNEWLWTKDSEAIRRRAAFEMSCPTEKIELQVLKTYDGSVRANVVGAAGCAHRLVYVHSYQGDSWVLNSSDAQDRQ